MQSNFDPTASNFERYRSLPAEVPRAIRAAIWGALRLSTAARVLEIGAGTGRIGKAFVAAGDFYVGVDTSLAMLQEFPATSKSCILAQADGRQLPFRDGTFDVVLLMQVLSGIGDWQGILSETRRVLLPGGSVAVGHTISPESGIDAQLKRQLAAILEEMGVAWHRPKESRRRGSGLAGVVGRAPCECPGSFVECHRNPAGISGAPPHRRQVCRPARQRARAGP